MRPVLTGSAITAFVVVVVFGACKKEEPPPQNPQGWQQGQPGYGQPGTTQPGPAPGGYTAPQPGYTQPQPGYTQPQPGYTQPQPGYPQPQPGYTQPAPTVATPPPATTGTAGMNPTPQGVPCSSDAQCLTHRCNVGAGKCSWPCQGPADCAAGMQCIAPICVPSVPTATPASAK
jgi:hypothetical protein